MNPFISFIRSWKFSLLGLLFLLFGLISYYTSQEQAFSITAVQKRFSELEKAGAEQAKLLLKQLDKGQKLAASNELTYHLYQNDVLFGWSSNQLPVGRYKTAVFPDNGLIKLNNGYYFSQSVQKDSITSCVSFCLLKAYEFSNAYLNAANPKFWKQQFSVNLTGERRHAIFDSKQQLVFYATPLAQNTNSNNKNWGPLFILIAAFLICYEIQTHFEKSWIGSLLLLLGLLVTRIILYEITWPLNWQ
jgi:hypothetical protein